MNKTVTIHEEKVSFPAKWEVCYDCDGRGSTYLGWTSSDQPAFTSEDFDREGPDFQEDYMKGRYDKTCPTCKGRTTVLVVVDREFIPVTLLDDYNKWQEQLREEAEYQAVCAAERRMGA